MPFLTVAICVWLAESCACQHATAEAIISQTKPTGIRFAEALADFPSDLKNLRKWDAPVFADLDQDGYVDLILNDHGFGVRICWNNRGRFAKPYDLIMGDLHGISVGDFDHDGLHELVISPGGGSGENARKAKFFRVDRKRKFSELADASASMALMRGRTVKFFDGDNDGDLDLLNFAFPSQGRGGESENYIYENNGEGRLTLAGVLPAVEKDGQKTLLTDFNGDGVADLVLYGQGRVQAYQGRGDLTYADVTDVVFPTDLPDVTCVVEFDFDNDGDFDLFFTRGKEFERGETFFDRAASTLGFFSTRGGFQFEDLVVGDILNVENLQSQWPHKRLFLGESAYGYEFPGETHSGRDLRLVNSDALGWPDQLDKKGAYLGYVGNEKWRLAGDIWSPVTGVLHPVRSYSKYEHPAGLRDILLENKGGRFQEAKALALIFPQEHTTGAAVADLDNNGFQDLVVIRRGDLIHPNKSLIFLNLGERGFELRADHGVISPELGAIGLGVDCLDYDHDELVDVLLGNERGKWRLFRNQNDATPDENFITIVVGESKSGLATSMGAIVTLQTDQGKQSRRVGATGAAYSQGLNPVVHFGLGNVTGPVSVKVLWTNGEVTEQQITTANGTIKLGSFSQ